MKHDRPSANFHQVFRRLLRDRHYPAGVILVLALGVAPAIVGLSIREDVLMRPLEYRDPDRLGVVRIDLRDLNNHSGLSPTEIIELRELRDVLEGVESVIVGQIPLDVGDETTEVLAPGVSRGLLRMLGVSPAVGRLFTQEDPQSSVAILGYSLWQTRFGGDSGIVGRVVTVGGRPREVVGVLPPDFKLRLAGSHAGSEPDIWTLVPPERINPGSGWLWGWTAVVRLRDGISFRQANQALEAFSRHQMEAFPEIYRGSVPRFTITPLLADLVREVRPAIHAALLGVFLLLMTAVVNASALLVLASKKRERELAIRTAIGAGRGMLIADALGEGLILGVVGVSLSWLLAVWGIGGVRAFIPQAVPRWETITLAWGPAALVATCTVLALMLASALAVWMIGMRTPWRTLTSAPGDGSGASGRGQAVLVGIQVTMTVVLLFGAAQLARSVRRLAATGLGFRPKDVVAFEVSLATAGFTASDKPWENRQYHLIRDRLREIPGVNTVGAVSSPPLRSRGTVNTFVPGPGGIAPTPEDRVANFYAVLPGYFESVQIPFVQGRDFTDQENLEGQPVAVIDETLARTAFAGSDPIGKTLEVHVPGGSRTPQIPDPRIVGVVRHARVIDPTRDVRPQIYLPFGLWRWAPLYFTVRARNDPLSVLPSARAIVKELGVGHPVSAVQLLTDNLDAHTSTLRSMAILVVALAVSASLLSAVGLFAVASYAVVRRRRSIAIRSAVGGSPGRLLSEQLRESGAILAVAIPVGVVISLAGARVLESLVYGVSVWDTGSLLAAAVLGGVIGLLGTYVPARRAARIDPAIVLKAE